MRSGLQGGAWRLRAGVRRPGPNHSAGARQADARDQTYGDRPASTAASASVGVSLHAHAEKVDRC